MPLTSTSTVAVGNLTPYDGCLEQVVLFSQKNGGPRTWLLLAY